MLLRRAALAGAALLVLILTGGIALSAPIPQLPKDLHIVDKAGEQIAPPELRKAGWPLIISNSPEVIDYSYPAALYRTPIKADHVRVFFHHQNGSGQTLKIGVAITNPAKSRRTINIYINRNSQMLPRQHKRTVDFNPRIAGERALHFWTNSKRSDSYLCTLAPGKTHYILQSVPNGATISGMYDLGVKNSKIGVCVTVLSCKQTPPDPTVLHVLAPDRLIDGSIRRGLFAHSDRVGRIECDATRVSWLDIAGQDYGPWARPMKNEFACATDEPDGHNPGNYGVVYAFHVALKNPTADSVRVRCLLNAAGGPSYSLVTINGSCTAPGKMLSSYDSWICRDLTIAPKRTSEFILVFSLPGGSSGAHRLYFWPENKRVASTAKTICFQL